MVLLSIIFVAAVLPQMAKSGVTSFATVPLMVASQGHLYLTEMDKEAFLTQLQSRPTATRGAPLNSKTEMFWKNLANHNKKRRPPLKLQPEQPRYRPGGLETDAEMAARLANEMQRDFLRLLDNMPLGRSVHPLAQNGTTIRPLCPNNGLDPIIDVLRNENQPIDPRPAGGDVKRIEAVKAVICSWHIRTVNVSRASFKVNDAAKVRARGRPGDQAGHIVASQLGGMPDIDRNAFAQAGRFNYAGTWPQFENSVRGSFRGPEPEKVMVIYNVNLFYEDENPDMKETRPSDVYFLAQKWRLVDSAWRYQGNRECMLHNLEQQPYPYDELCD